MDDKKMTYEELLAERDQYQTFAEQFRTERDKVTEERDVAHKKLADLAKQVEAVNPLKQRITELENEKILRLLGVPEKELDYVQFRVSQIADGSNESFTEVAKKYVNDPRYKARMETAPTPAEANKSTLDRLYDQKEAEKKEMARRLFFDRK